MSTAANLANIREQAKGPKRLKLAAGSVTVADGITAVSVVTGLSEVAYAVVTASSGTTAQAAVVAKTAGSGTMTVKGAAAGTFDWFAYGY